MRLEQLTFTRFLAAISIVIFHYGQNITLFNNKYVSFIFEQANFGVSYFFILSGFVMIIAYNNKVTVSFFQFIKNRFARIYPLYFLAILLVLLINHFRVEDYQDVLLNITMLQTWVPLKALSVNPPGWSLSVELVFYVLFPFLFNKIYKKNSVNSLTVCLIVFWLISQVLFYLIVSEKLIISGLTIKTILYHPLFHLNEFLIGNIAGLWFVKNHKEYKGNYWKLIMVFIVAFLLLLKINNGLIYHNGLLALVFTPIIVLLSLSKGYFVNFLSKKQFVFLGEISFGIYILQFPTWLFLSDLRMKNYFNLLKGEDDFELFFLRIIVLIFISAISYKFYETPIRKNIKRKFKQNSQNP